MATIYDLTASQQITSLHNEPHTPLVTWTKQRQFGSGAVKVKLDDVTVDEGFGPVPFDYVDYRIGIYKRSPGTTGQIAIKTIRKRWGVNPGWITIGTVGGGYFSLQTQLVSFEPYGLGGGPNPWVTATFDLIHG